MAVSQSFHDVQESQSGQVTCTVLDETGAAVALASVNTITMTSYDNVTDQIIGGRSAQNVLNANNGTFHATSGLFTWTVLIADTALANPQRTTVEEHIHSVRILWSSSTKAYVHQFVFRVQPLRHVP